jgi:DNA polymerase-1
MTEETLFLIDANSIIHRCYHALPPLTTQNGRPGQALYGLSSVLIKLLREEHPTYAAALFDRPEPTFRKQEYAEYKATRPKAADELVEQIIAAHDLFPHFGIPVFDAPGFEADDLIATFAARFGGSAGLRVVVLTGDYDTLQLVRSGVFVRIFRKGITDTVTYDEAGVIGRYGIPPEKLKDYKALVGDVSDNIPGVPGVGPKTATSLIARYGSIEALYRAAASDARLAEKLGASREQAERSKRLVTLRTDAPLHATRLDELRIGTDEKHLSAYLLATGFSSLERRLRAGTADPPPASSRSKRSRGPATPQRTLF